MARADRTQEIEPQDDDREPESGDEASVEERPRRSRVPAWLLSGAIHLVALSVMGLVVFASGFRDEDDVVFHAPPPVPRPDIADHHTTLLPSVNPQHPLDVVVPDVEPTPSVDHQLEDQQRLSDQIDDSDLNRPEGQADALSVSDLGNQGLAIAIGAASGDAGKRGDPDPHGRWRSEQKTWAPPGAIGSAQTALRWFKRHQSPNGQWSVDGYQNNCSEGAKCEPGSEHTGEEGDIACSGYALMCFLGAGYDQRMPSPFKLTVKKGIEYLLSVQKPDGSFGNRNYEHAIATMALADAYGSSNDPALRAPVQKAVDVLLARQNPDAKGGYGLGWDYKDRNPGRNDSSVTGWCVMALKSAAAAGLSVGSGLEGAHNWLEKAWAAANPGAKKLDPYAGRSVFPYTFNGESGATDKDHLAAVGAMCAVFLGHKIGDPMLETLCNQIMATDYAKSLSYPTNTYLLYYNTLAIFQASNLKDGRWKQWSENVCGMLIKNQRQDDSCFNGSWDFAGTEFHGHQTGRLLSTAYCCLSVEVYYRHKHQDEVRK